MLSRIDHRPTVGLGEGIPNQDLLRLIAYHRGGRFHAVPDPNTYQKSSRREPSWIAQQAGSVEDWFSGPTSREPSPGTCSLQGIALNSTPSPLLHCYYDVATQLTPPPASWILQSETRRSDSWRLGVLALFGRWPGPARENNWSKPSTGSVLVRLLEFWDSSS